MKRSIEIYIKLIIIVIVSLLVTTGVYEVECETVFSTETMLIKDYEIIEKSVISESFINYLYKNNENDYISKIYDYETKKEIELKSLIKEDCIDKYNEKIKELIYLKYPKFISDELSQEYGKNSYLFRDNELVIYFNDYNLEMDEVLYLKVNYNEIYKYLNFSVSLDSHYQNESGFNYQKEKKTIAFTFDDSPNKGKTEKLLQILNDNYAHATFFMLGDKMEYNEYLVDLVYKSHNEIGTHTYHHQNLKRITKEEIKTDFEEMNNLYHSITNDYLKLFRPPYGIVNKDMPLLNVSYIMWNIDTLDWKYRSSDYIVNHVLDHVSDGDIILFHDSYNSTVEAIEELIPLLIKRGYQIVSVSELARLKDVNLEVGAFYNSFK